MSTSPAENIKVVLKPVKTAFTGQIMLLTVDESVEYEKLSKIFVEYHKPFNYEEELLVQSIIDNEWRVRQISATEQGLLAIGRVELADTMPGYLLPAAAYLKYQKEIKDLSLQEHRLRRYLDVDMKKLQALQSARLGGRNAPPQDGRSSRQTATTASASTASCRSVSASISTHSPHHR